MPEVYSQICEKRGAMLKASLEIKPNPEMWAPWWSKQRPNYQGRHGTVSSGACQNGSVHQTSNSGAVTEVGRNDAA